MSGSSFTVDMHIPLIQHFANNKHKISPVTSGCGYSKAPVILSAYVSLSTAYKVNVLEEVKSFIHGQ